MYMYMYNYVNCVYLIQPGKYELDCHVHHFLGSLSIPTATLDVDIQEHMHAFETSLCRATKLYIHPQIHISEILCSVNIQCANTTDILISVYTVLGGCL